MGHVLGTPSAAPALRRPVPKSPRAAADRARRAALRPGRRAGVRGTAAAARPRRHGRARGGAGATGERALLSAGRSRWLALLHSLEWYGGGAPPGPLPGPAAAGVRARRRDAAAHALRAGAALAVRAAAAERARRGGCSSPGRTSPSTRATAAGGSPTPSPGASRPTPAISSRRSCAPAPATVVVPLGSSAPWRSLVVALDAAPPRLRPRRSPERRTALWLAGGGRGRRSSVTQRTDRVVELEDPQVERTRRRASSRPRGRSPGSPSPTAGGSATARASRCRSTCPPRAAGSPRGVAGRAGAGAAPRLLVSWDGGAPAQRARGAAAARVGRAPRRRPAPGRHRLRIIARRRRPAARPCSTAWWWSDERRRRLRRGPQPRAARLRATITSLAGPDRAARRGSWWWTTPRPTAPSGVDRGPRPDAPPRGASLPREPRLRRRRQRGAPAHPTPSGCSPSTPTAASPPTTSTQLRRRGRRARAGRRGHRPAAARRGRRAWPRPRRWTRPAWW